MDFLPVLRVYLPTLVYLKTIAVYILLPNPASRICGRWNLFCLPCLPLKYSSPTLTFPSFDFHQRFPASSHHIQLYPSCCIFSSVGPLSCLFASLQRQPVPLLFLPKDYLISRSFAQLTQITFHLTINMFRRLSDSLPQDPVFPANLEKLGCRKTSPLLYSSH